MELSHFDSQGNAWMVDIGEKEDTVRQAIAKGSIFMSRECLEKVEKGSVKKGDVLGTARIAGIMGAKRTWEMVPLCHMISLTKLTIDFHINEAENEIQAVCTACTKGKTGVEMEALTGVTTALLTIYDMCKAIDKEMEISGICLCRKTGGKSGDFINSKLSTD